MLRNDTGKQTLGRSWADWERIGHNYADQEVPDLFRQ